MAMQGFPGCPPHLCCVSLTAAALRVRPQVPVKKLIKHLGRDQVLKKIAEFEAESEQIIFDACERAVAEIDDEAAGEEARARAAERAPEAAPGEVLAPGAAAEVPALAAEG